MKKIILIIILFSIAAYSAVQDTINVDVHLRKALTISPDTDAVTNNFTYDSDQTSTHNPEFLIGEVIFTVEGEPSEPYTVVILENFNLTSGSETIVATNSIDALSSGLTVGTLGTNVVATGPLLETGTTSFKQIIKANISGQGSGSYTGIVLVTVAYN